MTRLALTLSLLAAVSSPALAGPTQIPRTDAPAPRQQRYWMSQDFQRLVFWKAQDPSAGSRR